MGSYHDPATDLHGLVDQLTTLSKSFDGVSPPDVGKRTAMAGVAKQIVAACMDPADMSSYHSVQVGRMSACTIVQPRWMLTAKPR